jgi:hypothetical protein
LDVWGTPAASNPSDWSKVEWLNPATSGNSWTGTLAADTNLCHTTIMPSRNRAYTTDFAGSKNRFERQRTTAEKGTQTTYQPFGWLRQLVKEGLSEKAQVGRISSYGAGAQEAAAKVLQDRSWMSHKSTWSSPSSCWDVVAFN